MNNKKSYVEIMKELEIVLPSPKDFDYSKANKEEITNRIMSLLKSITPPDLIIALNEFNRNDNNITSWNSKTFDGVGRLTNISQSISIYLDNIIDNEIIYNVQFGSTEEIEEYIEKDNIESYIKKAFDIKRYNYESYDLIPYLSTIKDIMVHYGISDRNIDLKKLKHDLLNAIEKDNNIEKDIETKERKRRMEEMFTNDDISPINISSSSKK